MEVTDVSDLTGFPEVMGGRVKTLHPRVYMSVLQRSTNDEDQKLLKKEKLEPFDLVIVNLYPFEKTLSPSATLEEMIEVIDIGGPSLLRASAKNFTSVTVVCDPSDYSRLSEFPDEKTRRELAAKAFFHVSSYDAMIGAYLNPNPEREFSIGGEVVQTLRYGENPHQKALWYRQKGLRDGWHQAKILQGKELSFNNLLDLEAARRTILNLDRPAACAVKHNNPCGVAIDDKMSQALSRCLKADPTSVFGGIIAVNREVTSVEANLLNEIFLECVVAPKFHPDALQVFAKKKNLRLLEWPSMFTSSMKYELRLVEGGFLWQEVDVVSNWTDEWQCLNEKPTESIRRDLELAWRVCAQLKSNAIAIVEHGMTLGLGMGQVNRVDAVEHAIGRMRQFHKAGQPVLASDAFFPFPDSIEKIAQAGIRWVIQPGGSMKDPEVFKRALDLGVNLILTGQRHFRH